MDVNKMSKNRADMNRCERMYRRVSAVYVLACGFYILADALLFLMSMNGDLLYLLLNGLVFKGAVLAAGFLGTYRKSNLFAGAAPLIMLFNTVLFWNADDYFDKFLGGLLGIKINAVYLAASVVLAVLTIISNAKYRYLEQQEGFPQFSEVFEQQKTGKPQYGLTFEERVEQIRKSARSDMEELSAEAPLTDDSRQSVGKMDEI